MKLRNRKTGKIVEFRYLQSDHVAPLVLTTYENDKPEMYSYTSLAELNEEWEDYEDTKEYWYLENNGDIDKETYDGGYYDERMIEIGNYFETREEAEKAVEKLKAWKRLKDDGLKIRRYELNGGTDRNGCFTGDICLALDISKPVYEDILQLLFGGEE